MLAVVCYVACISGSIAIAAESTKSIVTNGDFQKWTGGTPDDWNVDIGAKNGADEPTSQLVRLNDPGLSLVGDASTTAWHILGQEVPVRAGGTYTLEFQALSKGVQRQGHQFDNCYVGVMCFDAAGKKIDMTLKDLSRISRWTKQRLDFRVPDNAAKTKVLIFLSKTGTLSVKGLRILEATPGRPFEVLVDSLKDDYSFTALKGIDWDDLAARYRDKAESADTIDGFADAIRGMLAELEDLHVWIELPDGRRVSSYSSRYRGNFNRQAVERQLDACQRFGRVGVTGRTKEGFGVAAILGLPPGDDNLYSQLIDAMTAMSDAPGFIVDLRSNSGGAEPRARQIAGLFADKRYLYARSKIRSGPNADDFRESRARHIEPATSKPFTRPVVCLIGPGCVSSGEGFALMMKAMDHVTMVGQPTRGASGNPHPVTLPNGVKVWFSRWVSMEPDGTSIEGRGIQPDVTVEHTGEGDPTFDKAVEILREKTGFGSAVPVQ